MKHYAIVFPGPTVFGPYEDYNDAVQDERRISNETGQDGIVTALNPAYAEQT